MSSSSRSWGPPWCRLVLVSLVTLCWTQAGHAQQGARAERARRARAAHLLEVGERHRQAGDLGSAIGYFRDAVSAWPHGGASYVALGDAYLSRGSLRDALAAFDAGLVRRPSDVPLLLGRARALEALGRGAEAAWALRRATRGPGEADAWRARALLAQRRGAWLEALSAWRALRELSPEHGEDASRAIRALRLLVREMDPARLPETSQSPVARALAASDL